MLGSALRAFRARARPQDDGVGLRELAESVGGPQDDGVGLRELVESVESVESGGRGRDFGPRFAPLQGGRSPAIPIRPIVATDTATD